MKKFGTTIAGFGGQGVLFVGEVLAHAGMLEGNYISWIPSYGAEMRGGTAHCFVTIAEKEISSPLVETPEGLLIFNKPSLEKFEPSAAESGYLLLNSSLVDINPKRSDLNIYKLPASEMAAELGNNRVFNLIMLGAFVKVTGVVDSESVKKALEEIIPEKKKKLLPLNLQAFNKGLEAV
ncbi:MAG: 2-oxoacid:acceptor oxidoreductase family protein [Bacillota bacterium]